MEVEWIYSDAEINWRELSELYRLAPLGDKKAEDLKIVFQSSLYKCFLYKSGKLIGAGRALADGLDCSYICDVAVHPEFQGIGLGKSILNKLITLSERHKKIILYSVPGKEEFYSKCGFKRMNTALAIFSNEKHAVEIGLINET